MWLLFIFTNLASQRCFKIMKIKETNLWPTRVWEVEDLFDEEFNNSLLEELLLWKEEYGPWTGLRPNYFRSDKPLINIAREKFMDIIKEVTKPYFGDSFLKIKYDFSKGWLMETPPGSCVNIHPHDSASLAMIYYLQTTDNCGDLVLVDPRRGGDFTQVITVCGKCKRYTPTVGKLIIIPGYILHEVMQNNSDIIRYSFAANVVLTNPSENKDY